MNLLRQFIMLNDIPLIWFCLIIIINKSVIPKQLWNYTFLFVVYAIYANSKDINALSIQK
ncbi:hypothetical protein bsdE14_32780 [Clostridium omnivorum]|uniref:Uncharacterized protein n=1 Tax=Clostridium omnivorum TaxID=1604902 RepID=A0ABQ5N9H4_9CLOT|nr:hypothetical protein bsdE14_32780 [Clostridium sp. E14]